MKILELFERLWRFRLYEMQEFLRLTESGVTGEFQRFGDWFDKNTAGMTRDEVEEFVDHYYDDLAMVRDVAPQILRYAQFLCVFGTFEYCAADVYRTLHLAGKTKRKPASNMYLYTTQKYLISHVGFKKRVFGKEWRFLLDARGPRNAIAHNDGWVRNGTRAKNGKRVKNDDRDKKVRQFIKEQPHLDLERSSKLSRIIVRPDFLEELLQRMEIAMQALLAEAKTK